MSFALTHKSSPAALAGTTPGYRPANPITLPIKTEQEIQKDRQEQEHKAAQLQMLVEEKIIRVQSSVAFQRNPEAYVRNWRQIYRQKGVAATQVDIYALHYFLKKLKLH